MKTQICVLPEEQHVHIETEPVSSLVIQLTDLSSLQELQDYTQAYGITWVLGNQGLHCLLLPWGTLQQRIEECSSEREEVYLIHLPGGGALEHRRVLHQSVEPGHPWAEALRVSTLSLLRPLS